MTPLAALLADPDTSPEDLAPHVPELAPLLEPDYDGATREAVLAECCVALVRRLEGPSRTLRLRLSDLPRRAVEVAEWDPEAPEEE